MDLMNFVAFANFTDPTTPLPKPIPKRKVEGCFFFYYYYYYFLIIDFLFFNPPLVHNSKTNNRQQRGRAISSRWLR